LSVDDTYTTQAWFTFTTDAIGKAVSISGNSGRSLFVTELNDVGTDRTPPQGAEVTFTGHNITSGLDTRIRIDVNPNGSADADGGNSRFIDFQTNSTDPVQVAAEIQAALEGLPGFGAGDAKHVEVTGSGTANSANFTFKTDVSEGATVNLSVKIGSDDKVFSTTRTDNGKDRVPPAEAEVTFSNPSLRSTSTVWITLQTGGVPTDTQVELPDNAATLNMTDIANHINTELSTQGFSGVNVIGSGSNLIFRSVDVGATTILTVKIANEDDIFKPVLGYANYYYDAGVNYVPSEYAAVTLSNFSIPTNAPARIRLDVLLNDWSNWANASENNPTAIHVDVPTGLGSMAAVVNHIQAELYNLGGAYGPGGTKHITVSNPSGNNLLFTVDASGTDNAGTTVSVKIEGQTSLFPGNFDRGTDKPSESAKVSSSSIDISGGLPGTTVKLEVSLNEGDKADADSAGSIEVDISSTATDEVQLASDIQTAINNAIAGKGWGQILVDPEQKPTDPPNQWQFRFETDEIGRNVSISIKSTGGIDLFPAKEDDEGTHVPDEPAWVESNEFDLAANDGLVMILDMDVRTDGSNADYNSGSRKTISVHYRGTSATDARDAIQNEINALGGDYAVGGSKHVTVSANTVGGNTKFTFTTDEIGEDVSISVKNRPLDSTRDRGEDVVNAEPAHITSNLLNISDGLRVTFKLDVETTSATRADWNSGNAVTVEVDAPTATTEADAILAIQNAINALGGDYAVGGSKHVTVSANTVGGRTEFIFTTVNPPVGGNGNNYSISAQTIPTATEKTAQGSNEQLAESASVNSNISNDVRNGAAEPFRAIFNVSVNIGGDVLTENVEVISSATTADGVANDIQTALENSGFVDNTGGGGVNHHVSVTSNQNNSSAIFYFTTDEIGANVSISVSNLSAAKENGQGTPDTQETAASVTSQSVDVTGGELDSRLIIDVSDDINIRADSDSLNAKIVNLDISNAGDRFGVAAAIQAAIEALGGDYALGGSKHVTVTASGSDAAATFTFTTDTKGGNMSISINDDVTSAIYLFQRKEYDEGEGGFPVIKDSTPAAATSRMPITFDGNLVIINNTLNIGVSLDGSEPDMETVNIDVYETDPTAMAQKIEAEIEEKLGGQYAQNRERHISVEAVPTGTPNEYYFKFSTDATGSNVRLRIEPEAPANGDVYLFNSLENIAGQDGNDKLKINVDGEEVTADLNPANIFHHGSLARELRDSINRATKYVQDINAFVINESLTFTSGMQGRESLLEIMSGTGNLLSDIGFTEGAKDLGSGSTFSFQLGGDKETLEYTIGLLGTEVMGIHNINVRSRMVAMDAISKIGDAIDYVSTIETQMGAAVNELWNRVDIAESHRENLLKQVARLKETDFAKEASQFAKLQNLLRSGLALYAYSKLPAQQMLWLLNSGRL